MSLEDAFGDIIRKARRGQNIGEKDLAEAGGISVADLGQIESYELNPDSAVVAKLADRLSLKSDALIGMARETYYPADVDITRWGTISTLSSPYSDYIVNAFLVWDGDTKEAILFDTGTDFEAIKKTVNEHSLKLTTLALTHTHGDHVEVIDQVTSVYSPKILTSRREPVPGAAVIKEGDTFKAGSLTVKVLETEGHSPGGLTFVISGFQNAPDVAVVGDAIFAGSAGGAIIDYKTLHSHIKNKIFTLPDDTLVLPGHGPLTTIGSEKINNPFAP